MQPAQSNYDLLAKVITLGDSGVGKTALLIRFCEDSFTMDHISTIGVDFKSKMLPVDGKNIKVQVWDTGCQERYSKIAPSFYKSALGIILVYDVTDRLSFTHVKNWIDQVKENATEGIFIVLVANKVDLPERDVNFEEGKALADSYGLKFFESSAKEDININEAFYSITKDIKEKYIGKAKENYKESIMISSKNNSELISKRKCC